MKHIENNFIASKCLMIEPTHFGTNYEALNDNSFMTEANFDVQPKALEEFKNFVENLMNNNVDVIVYKQPFPEAKDSIFPNNWFSTHRNEDFPEGLLIIYPLKSKSRRIERNPQIIEELKKQYKYFMDLSFLEQDGEYLESTGCLIFDNFNKNIYCGISERATENALNTFIKGYNKISKTPYNLILLHPSDLQGNTIYHTNVMLSVLEKHIVVCLDSLKDLKERQIVENIIKNSEGKKLLVFSMEEMQNFCCNIINLKSATENTKSCLIISKTAIENLRLENKIELEENYLLIINDISVIEKIGGGSSRCMVAEIY